MEITVFILVMVFIKINGLESTEDDSDTNPYNSFAPSTSNFQDIYTSTFNRHNEETTLNEDDFLFPSIKTQSAELNSETSKTSRITSAPTENTLIDNSEQIKVVPIRTMQRGVLDILFPATRVKSFKNVFDSVRQILSSTFRK